MTPQQLAAAVGCRMDVAVRWLEPILDAAARWQIDRPERMAAWLAQVGHESAGLMRLEESLNYGAEGLATTWPLRFAIRGADGRPIPGRPNAQAQSIARKPAAIATAVYSGRLGNGDEASGDGWRYRGRGPIQITGRDNYAACGDACGLPLVDHPELLSADPGAGAASAGWFWASRGCNDLADRGAVRSITRAINGGFVGLDDRIARWERARRALGIIR